MVDCVWCAGACVQVRTLRSVVLPVVDTQASFMNSSKRRYFLLFLGVLQLLFAVFLVRPAINANFKLAFPISLGGGAAAATPTVNVGALPPINLNNGAAGLGVPS